MTRAAILTDREWLQNLLAPLPGDWQERLTHKWAEVSRPYPVQYRRHGITYQTEALQSYDGNLLMRETMERMKSTRLRVGVSDQEIRERAERVAGICDRLTAQIQCRDRLKAALRYVAGHEGITTPWDRKKDGTMNAGGIARMKCAKWWRRNLRGLYAKAVEGAAIGLGFVNRARDRYVSDESVKRRAQQNRRNARILETVRMQNELGQEFTLAELAARSTANKSIRRGELMTRIAGFEKIARECDHEALFLTITCPSRMHKWAVVPGTSRVQENKDRYDGTLPREAQQHLSRVWARIRSALHRRGLKIYGFRIAEPNHDGTPHWHLLLFCGAVPGRPGRAALPRVAAICRRYALGAGEVEEQRKQIIKGEIQYIPWRTKKTAREKHAEKLPERRAALHAFDVAERRRQNTSERGAKKHRVDVKPIDWSRGTAAGYIAKYVAKNIDGMYIETDLLGDDSMHTSARVEAWASTWGIRQFQQIGGAPVGVWRELRRVKELPEDAPEHMRQAWEACNKWEGAEDGATVRARGGLVDGRAISENEEREPSASGSGKDGRGADFANYVKAQGGVFVGRDYRLRLKVEERAGLGVYGDPLAPAPVGVETLAEVREAVGALGCYMLKTIQWVVQSVRHAWRVVRGEYQNRRSGGAAARDIGGAVPEVRGGGNGSMHGAGGHPKAGAAARGQGEAGFSGALARPRTRVNNCTPESDPGGGFFATGSPWLVAT